MGSNFIKRVFKGEWHMPFHCISFKLSSAQLLGGKHSALQAVCKPCQRQKSAHVYVGWDEWDEEVVFQPHKYQSNTAFLMSCVSDVWALTHCTHSI